MGGHLLLHPFGIVLEELREQLVVLLLCQLESVRQADAAVRQVGFPTGDYYVYDKNDKEDKDLLKYLHVDETPMGAWQIYLLMTSPTLLPTFWHGGYIERRFILQPKDLYEIEAICCCDLSDLVKQEMLYPSVAMKRNAGLVIAFVSCCYWNEWKGLVREQVEIRIQDGRVISYDNKGDFNIYKYHCGIYF